MGGRIRRKKGRERREEKEVWRGGRKYLENKGEGGGKMEEREKGVYVRRGKEGEIRREKDVGREKEEMRREGMGTKRKVKKVKRQGDWKKMGRKRTCE